MFKDSPAPEEFERAVSDWPLPDLSGELQGLIPEPDREGFPELCRWFKRKLDSTDSIRLRKRLEKSIITWLYEFIRLNVKRGRIFDLRQVLRTGDADCLGYAKLLTTLGRQCGLDLGIAEVLIDNRNRIVPHTATLVRLAGGGRQFVDFWYGSTDIRHKRLGLQVKKDGQWQVTDIDFRKIKTAEDASYLPEDCVDGITLYISGNRSLKDLDYSRAVEQYSEAIRLYPQNVRAYYNRALAYEKMGQPQKAQADYTRALRDETALKRTLAVQPEDVVDLIQLDEKFIPELDQQIYLLHAGYITGRKASPEQIAERLDIPAEEVEAVLSMIETLLAMPEE